MKKPPILKKLNRLETHDRLEHIKKSEFDIGACCQDIIDKRPFGNHSFYIFAHARTDDEQAGIKRMIWQPRLTKPKAQENSMLFRVSPGSDEVKIMWMIPAKEMWGQFIKGQMFHSPVIVESIHDFQYNLSKLEQKEPDDLSDADINAIYKEISKDGRASKNADDKVL